MKSNKLLNRTANLREPLHHGTSLLFVESIDTTSSGGQMVFHIFGPLAELEHNQIRERSHAGLEAARAIGRKGGRKPKLSVAVIQKAQAMLSEPQNTKTEVARHFNVSRTMLNSALLRLKTVKKSD
tara:strand:- start:7677 stop:8054 length:378 start_codon:yes stop_codon:yes gene_type:complete